MNVLCDSARNILTKAKAYSKEYPNYDREACASLELLNEKIESMVKCYADMTDISQPTQNTPSTQRKEDSKCFPEKENVSEPTNLEHEKDQRKTVEKKLRPLSTVPEDIDDTKQIDQVFFYQINKTYL